MKTPVTGSFAAQLKGLREAAGFTQEELATFAGLSVHAISSLERGQRRRPHLETVRALTSALELTGDARDALFESARATSNDTVVEELKKGAQQVKQYGEEKGFSELTTAKWACPADYAGTLTAAAGYILKAKGAYRGPIEDGYVYLLITDIKKVDEKH